MASAASGSADVVVAASLRPFASLSCVRTLKAHTQPVQVVKFNANGKYCLSGGQDRSVMLWNPHRDAAAGEAAQGGLLIKEYKGHGYDVSDVCMSSDNSKFASCGGDKCAYLWDVQSGAVTRRVFGHDHRLSSVAFNEDATVLVTAANDKAVRCWDLRSHGRAALQSMADFKDGVTRVICTRTEIIASCMDGTLHTYDLRAGRAIVDDVHHPVADVALSNDGNCLLAASPAASARLTLIDRAAGAALAAYGGHVNTGYALRVAFSADDALVLSGSEDGALCAWDLVKSTLMHRIAAHTRAVACVSMLPRPELPMACLTASFDGTLKLWTQGGEDVVGL